MGLGIDCTVDVNDCEHIPRRPIKRALPKWGGRFIKTMTGHDLNLYDMKFEPPYSDFERNEAAEQSTSNR